MATTTDISAIALNYFRGDVTGGSLFRGLSELGLIQIFASVLISLAIALLVARVFAGCIMNGRMTRTMLLSVLLIILVSLIPAVESAGLSSLGPDSISVNSAITLGIELFIPIFILIGSIWGVLELLRFVLGVRLETELQRFLAAVSLIFLCALAVPSFESITSKTISKFIHRHAVPSGGLK